MATEYLVLLHRPRLCKKCKERTMWSLETQLWTDHGICLMHAGNVYERGDLPEETMAFRAIVRALGPVDALPEQAQSLTAEPATVSLRWLASGLIQRLTALLVPSYVGKCAGCGTAVRRYGPAGRPLCDHCA